MNGFETRVALVTGAGSESGIGFAAARILGERGARRGDRRHHRPDPDARR